MNLMNQYLNRIDFTDYEDFYHNCKIDYPEDFNFAFDIFDKQSDMNPKIAVKHVNENGKVEYELTYNELYQLSLSFYHYFKEIGVKKGDNVIVKLRRMTVWIPLVISLMKIGAVVCPCPDLIGEKEFEKRVEILQPKLIVDRENITDLYFKVLNKSMEWIPSLRWDECEKIFKLEKCTKITDVSFRYFTSGSTGVPKLVEYDYSFPLSGIPGTKYAMHYDNENDVIMNMADFGWIMFIKTFFGAIFNGSTIVIYDFENKIDVDGLYKTINECKVTSFFASPPVYYMLLNETNCQFTDLKDTMSSGSVLHLSLLEKWEKKTNLKLTNVYGQTEFFDGFGNFSFCEMKPNSIGRPYPGINAEIMNEEFVVDLKKNRPIQLSCNYKGDIYHSGDILTKDEDGNYFYVSRVDDIINTAGYRFSALEVEKCLMDIEYVKECLVIGVPDEKRSEIVKSLIVLKDGVEKSDELKKEIQNFVKVNLSSFKYPRIVEFVDELEKTASGKIKRNISKN